MSASIDPNKFFADDEVARVVDNSELDAVSSDSTAYGLAMILDKDFNVVKHMERGDPPRKLGDDEVALIATNETLRICFLSGVPEDSADIGNDAINIKLGPLTEEENTVSLKATIEIGINRHNPDAGRKILDLMKKSSSKRQLTKKAFLKNIGNELKENIQAFLQRAINKEGSEKLGVGRSQDLEKELLDRPMNKLGLEFEPILYNNIEKRPRGEPPTRSKSNYARRGWVRAAIKWVLTVHWKAFPTAAATIIVSSLIVYIATNFVDVPMFINTTFSPQLTVTIGSYANGSVVIERNDCASSSECKVERGSDLTLSISADEGYKLVELNCSGECPSGLEPGTSVSIQNIGGDLTITPKFRGTRTLRVNNRNAAMGNATCTVDGQSSNECAEIPGGTIKLEATGASPDGDSGFIHVFDRWQCPSDSWCGGLNLRETPVNITVPEALEPLFITPVFRRYRLVTLRIRPSSPSEANIAIAALEDGCLISDGCTHSRDGSTEVYTFQIREGTPPPNLTIMAPAPSDSDSLFRFAEWQCDVGQCPGGGSTAPLTLSADVTIKAVYTTRNVLVATDIDWSATEFPVEDCTTEDATLRCVFDEGIDVTLSPRFRPDQRFIGWRCSGLACDGRSLDSTSISGNFASSATLTPEYEDIVLANLNIGRGANGSATADCGSDCRHEAGWEVRVTARPDSGYTWERWDCTGSCPSGNLSSSVRFTINQDTHITPVFRRDRVVGDALKIGYLSDFSPEFAEFGSTVQAGVELAIAQINAGGGVNGQDVILATGDTGLSTEMAVSEARRLIDDENVHAIVEGIDLFTLKLVESVLADAQVPVISLSTLSPAIRDARDNDFLFHTEGLDITAEGLVLANYVVENAARSEATTNIGVVYLDGHNTGALESSFRTNFDGTVTSSAYTGTQAYNAQQDASATSFQQQLHEAKSAGANALLIIGSRETEFILREALADDLFETYYFAGLNAPHIYEEIATNVGTENVAGFFGIARSTGRNEFSDFDEAYMAKFGEAVPETRGRAIREVYDATIAIALAAASVDGELTGSAIRDQLRSVVSPPGTTIHPSAESVEAALDLIADGDAVNYDGLSSAIDWDYNGTPNGGFIDIWRFGADGQPQTVETIGWGTEEGEARQAAEDAAGYDAWPGGFLERALNGEFAGEEVTILGSCHSIICKPIYDVSLTPLSVATGIDIQYSSMGQFVGFEINTRVAAGDAPDIVDFPQPGPLQRFVSEGHVVDVQDHIPLSYLREQYLPGWVDASILRGPDGEDFVSGVWSRTGGTNSLVFYPKDDFDAAGYEIPETYDELIDLQEQIKDDGGTPWCVGIESDAATGRVATDWTEDLLLRTTSLENYDRWTIPASAGDRLRFDSPEVRRAIELWSDIWFEEGNVLGGRKQIVETSFGSAADGLFEDPPDCWLFRQTSPVTVVHWIHGLGQEPGVDFDAFYFPPVDEEFGRPFLMTSGNLIAAFNDDPATLAVLEFYASADSISGFLDKRLTISPFASTRLSEYDSVVDRKIVELLGTATALRFNGSALQPDVVGGSFQEEISAYVAGEQDLDTTLANIDRTWPAN